MFHEFDDWESRYGFIMELGKELAPFDAAEKIEKNKVHGCQSQVWLTSQRLAQDGHTVMIFHGDSDSLIVKGLLGIAINLYSNQTPEQIKAFDFSSFLEALSLQGSLSMTRSKGLMAVVKKIRDSAN